MDKTPFPVRLESMKKFFFSSFLSRKVYFGTGGGVFLCSLENLVGCLLSGTSSSPICTFLTTFKKEKNKVAFIFWDWYVTLALCKVAVWRVGLLMAGRRQKCKKKAKVDMNSGVHMRNLFRFVTTYLLDGS